MSSPTAVPQAAPNPADAEEFEPMQVDTTPAPDSTPETDRSAGLRKAYATATTRLREENRAEFDKLYVEEAAKLGIEYTPPMSPEQKAAKAVADLVAQYGTGVLPS